MVKVKSNNHVTTFFLRYTMQERVKIVGHETDTTRVR
jgi:hypothetical protein